MSGATTPYHVGGDGQSGAATPRGSGRPDDGTLFGIASAMTLTPGMATPASPNENYFSSLPTRTENYPEASLSTASSSRPNTTTHAGKGHFIETISVDEKTDDTLKHNEKPEHASAGSSTTAGKVVGAVVVAAPPKARVDYLAGVVAFASILVTAIHFSLTFIPAVQMPGAYIHYESEVIALKTITPFLLTFSWIGPFYTTSTRFLVGNYLKSGNLKNVAEKVVGRTPRLIIPCAAIAALEYFFMQVGATNWLECLASVTYSMWPFVSAYKNFGYYMSEVVELAFLIPNAVPAITFNYCIGVLWTIPVQLQNSWLCLLGVIVVREIKTPWKRFSYYALCIVLHWYALSWGSFFWVGLVIADLDITYKWKTWLNDHRVVYWVVLFFVVVLAIGSPGLDTVSMWTPFNFNTVEHDIHPEVFSGKAKRDTNDRGYPPYYIPRLLALTYATGIHLLVELSPAVQRFFSNRLLMWLFPHIMTLYLIHGFVFWTVGAWLCIHLQIWGLPYWANMLIVALVCYTIIFNALPFLTPVVETLGKNVTQSIWVAASRVPPPRRRSMFPFREDLFEVTEENSSTGDEGTSNEKGKRFSDNSSVAESGKRLSE